MLFRMSLVHCQFSFHGVAMKSKALNLTHGSLVFVVTHQVANLSIHLNITTLAAKPLFSFASTCLASYPVPYAISSPTPMTTLNRPAILHFNNVGRDSIQFLATSLSKNPVPCVCQSGVVMHAPAHRWGEIVVRSVGICGGAIEGERVSVAVETALGEIVLCVTSAVV